MLQTRPWTGVCELDAMVPKANNRRYVSSADLPSDSLHKNLAWWAVTHLKNQKPVKIGGWVLPRVWVLAWDNTVHEVQLCERG